MTESSVKARAHALCKAGSPKLASEMLENLVDRGVETQSLLASAYKDLWEQATDRIKTKNMLN